MSKMLSVTSEGELQYQIMLEQDFKKLPEVMQSLGYQEKQKLCIVTDSNVAEFYAGEVCQLLQNTFQTLKIHSFKAGEASKNTDTVNKLYEDLILNHFDRNDVLLALGGGVVGDLTGFTAATYLRGIDFIQIPTTLLSQVDSSIGGKTGVDFMQYKNMVGAFYQPKLVYMNLSVLKTLPEIQFISGMGEILKHGLIKDKNYYIWLKTHEEEIRKLEPNIVEDMIYRSCQIKREVVERDPKEKGERALLNFGHTIGHAVEKLSDFSLTHGECVGIGIAAAAHISEGLGNISQNDCEEIIQTLEAYGFRTKVSNLIPENVLETTKSDKKMVGNQVKFILLSEIGCAYIYKELTDEQILEGIRFVCES